MRRLVVLAAIMMFGPMAVAQQETTVKFGEPNSWTATSAVGADVVSNSTLRAVNGIGEFSLGKLYSTMGWRKAIKESPNLGGNLYVVIRYRAEHIGPGEEDFVWAGNAFGRNEAVTRSLLPLSQVNDDGRWHVFVTPLKEPLRVEDVGVNLSSGSVPARAWLDYVKFTASRPQFTLAEGLEYRKGFSNLRLKAGEYVTVNLGGAADTGSGAAQESLGLKDWFTGKEVTVEGIPFVLAGAEPSLVSGVKGSLKAVKVPAGSRAREAYLLLAVVLPTIDYTHASEGGERPFGKFDDPGRFVVRVRYQDGVEDELFPVRVRTGRYEVVDGLDLYCLPELRSVPLDNVALDCGMAKGRVMLAGVTLNRGAGLVKRPYVTVLPALVAERPLPEGKASVTVVGDVLTVSTRSLRAEFGIKPGVTLRRLQNKCLRGGSTQLGQGSIFELGMATKLPWQALEASASLSPGSVSTFGSGSKLLTSDKVKVVGVHREGNTVVLDVDARPEVPIAGKLRLTAAESGEIVMNLEVNNVSGRVLVPIVNFPTFSRVSLGDVQNTWYLHARQGGTINNLPARLREPYSGAYPEQVMGLFNPRLGGGMYMLVHDLEDIYKYYVTDKDSRGVDWRIEYFPREYQAGEKIDTAETVVSGNTGDWRAQLGAYGRWAQGWYKPMVARKDWFRDVYSYRQHHMRHEYDLHDPLLYDRATKKYRMLEVAARDRDFFGVSDYLHIFDFGDSEVYGRTGDYDHFEEVGGVKKLAAAIRGLEESGVPVGLYIEGYLCDEHSMWGKGHAAAGTIIKGDGSPWIWPHSTEHEMCAADTVWQDYLSGVYQRVAGELKPSGFYIDQYGFADPGKICWSREHGHPVPWAPLHGEREMLRKIRGKVPATIATLTEDNPTDMNSQLHDGSLSYTVAFNDPSLAPHRVDLFRFVFPDFKVFQLVSYVPFVDGGWERLKFPFFNGEGLWLKQDLSGFDSGAQGFLRKAFALLHTYAEAFRTRTPEPLVATENPLIYANAFPGEKVTVWTVFNADYRTYRGPVLAVAHHAGASYRDAWNGVDLTPEIKGGQAMINLTLGPREVGCVVQAR